MFLHQPGKKIISGEDDSESEEELFQEPVAVKNGEEEHPILLAHEDEKESREPPQDTIKNEEFKEAPVEPEKEVFVSIRENLPEKHHSDVCKKLNQLNEKLFHSVLRMWNSVYSQTEKVLGHVSSNLNEILSSTQEISRNVKKSNFDLKSLTVQMKQINTFSI